MDEKSLKYFRFAAVCRSLRDAAEHFHVAQSALSRQIRELEDELGVQLFVRRHQAVEVTAIGRRLQAYSGPLLAHHDRVLRRMGAAQGGLETGLSIATLAGFGPAVIDLVREFRRAYPSVTTSVEVIPFADITDSVLHGVHDLAFTLDYAVEDAEGIVRVPVVRDRFAAVMSSHGPQDFDGPVTVSDLLAQRLIASSHIEPPFLRQLRLLARDPRLAAVGVEHVPSPHTALLHANLGLGTAFLPPSAIPELGGDPADYCCHDVTGLDTSFSLLLIRRQSDGRAATSNFLELARTGRCRRQS